MEYDASRILVLKHMMLRTQKLCGRIDTLIKIIVDHMDRYEKVFLSTCEKWLDDLAQATFIEVFGKKPEV